MTTKLIKSDGYEKLLSNIRKELSGLEALVKNSTIRTYHKVGGYICEDLLENKDRADYGEYLIIRLAKDLCVNKTTLWRSIKFYNTYPIVDGRQQLTWDHYRALLTVKDDKVRRELEKRAISSNWNPDALRNHIKYIKQKKLKLKPEEIPQLDFTRGSLGVFEVIKDDDNQNQEGLVLDFGFRETVPLPEGEGGEYKEGDFVQVTSDGKKRSAVKVDIKKEEIYTYKAQVKKIIDGDTLIVRFGVEFGIAVRWKLRLRGIDCPEIDTPEGQRAKKFVEERLNGLEFIVVKTYKDRSDKYDRYLADIFYPPLELRRAGSKDETDPQKVADTGNFLNQELLNAGLAKKV